MEYNMQITWNVHIKQIRQVTYLFSNGHYWNVCSNAKLNWQFTKPTDQLSIEILIAIYQTV